MGPRADLFSPEPALLEASLSSQVWTAAHTPELPELFQAAPALAGEQLVDRDLKAEAASAKKQSRRPIKSAPRKKRKPWSALAPQYRLLNCSIQCNRGRPMIAVRKKASLSARFYLLAAAMRLRNRSPAPLSHAAVHSLRPSRNFFI